MYVIVLNVHPSSVQSIIQKTNAVSKSKCIHDLLLIEKQMVLLLLIEYMRERSIYVIIRSRKGVPKTNISFYERGFIYKIFWAELGYAKCKKPESDLPIV